LTFFIISFVKLARNDAQNDVCVTRNNLKCHLKLSDVQATGP